MKIQVLHSKMILELVSQYNFFIIARRIKMKDYITSKERVPSLFNWKELAKEALLTVVFFGTFAVAYTFICL